MTPPLEILECTLRDGSYPIAYQFTAEDTALLARGLEEAGFRRIEIGHGLGLGASRPSIGVAAATDEEYLAAARAVLTRAKFGAFFIPGIGDEGHVRLAAKHGMHFLRIGTNVNESEQAIPFIKQARDLGMEVSCNLMKTYAISRDDVVARAIELDRAGADTICVVDSAGGMVPHEVTDYVLALKHQVSAKIGFHGHNNLQLAIANTLAAIDAGAHVVDTTLRGIGRSSGNAQTEVLLMLLRKRGIDLGIDVFRTMDLAERFVAPLSHGRGVEAIEVVSGYAQFHSSFLPLVERVARESGVDVRELIIGVSEENKVHVTETLARSVASRTPRLGSMPSPRTISVQLPVTDVVDERPVETARRIGQEIAGLSKKMGRISAFTIAFAPVPSGRPRFPFIRASAQYVAGNAEVDDVEQAVEIARAVDGIVDVILVDASAQAPQALARVATVLATSRLLSYRDDGAHVDAAEAFLTQFLPSLPASRVGLAGINDFALKLALRLIERGCEVRFEHPDPAKAREAVALLEQWRVTSGGAAQGRALVGGSGTELDLLAGTAHREAVVDGALVDRVRPGGAVLDLGVGSLSRTAIERALARKLRVHRLDMRAGLSGQLTVALETRDVVERVMGRKAINGVPVVAGGVVGDLGDVVLDSLWAPTRVIGVADGYGQLLGPHAVEAWTTAVKRVEAALIAVRLGATK